MSSVDDAVTYVFTWRTRHDDKVCVKCASLDGHVVFYDLFADVLVSDTHGAIWDLNSDHSLAHGPHTYGCRCTLDVDVEVDWTKIAEFQELRDNLDRFNVKFDLVKERFKLSSSIAQARSQMNQFLGDLRQIKPELMEVNKLFTTYLALGDAAGLPPDLVGRLRGLEQMRVGIQAVNTAWQMMQAGGVLAFFTGGGGLLLGAFMAVGGLLSLMQIRRPQY